MDLGPRIEVERALDDVGAVFENVGDSDFREGVGAFTGERVRPFPELGLPGESILDGGGDGVGAADGESVAASREVAPVDVFDVVCL